MSETHEFTFAQGLVGGRFSVNGSHDSSTSVSLPVAKRAEHTILTGSSTSQLTADKLDCVQ